MAHDVVDDRLLGALHLLALKRSGFDHDPEAEHTAFQIGTLDALMAGHFDGDATIAELCAHGDFGLGTIEHLGGELLIVDGVALVASEAGVLGVVPPETRTPFAVVCHFVADSRSDLVLLSGFEEISAAVEAAASPASEITAVRIDGHFSSLRLRSVKPQSPPYVRLKEVTSHQQEFVLDEVDGTMIGFRFPDRVAGIEIPGYHFHFCTADRTRGGHVIDAALSRATLECEGADELHVEIPAGVGLGTPGVADRSEIRSVEGG